MEKFEQNILTLNEQLSLKALKFSGLEKLRGIKPDSIIVIGMGGSGIIGPILKNLAKDANINVPIISWNDYGLPAGCFKKPLLIFVSFSGNTEETISGYQKAQKYRWKAVVSGGGRLSRLAQKSQTALASF